MIAILPFIINAGMNFILGLLIALLLGPDIFGIYAIGAAILVLVNAALIDWLKLAAIRFYSRETRHSQPEVRATLDLLAAGIVLVVSACLVLGLLVDVALPLPKLLLAAAVMGGLCAGLFDFHGAIARARYLDGAYARLIIVKNLLALVLMVGAAWFTHDPVLVLAGGLASAAIALATVRHVLSDGPLRLGEARRGLVWAFARYGFPLVGANVIYSLMPLFNRSGLAATYDFAEAGYFSLASDMGIRLFGTLGAALEIVLLRQVVSIEQSEGLAAAHRRIAGNLPLVLMVLLPAATGWWLVLPAFEQVFVPAGFRGHFADNMRILTPAFLALGVLLAGLNPVFLIARRTGLAIFAALSGLALNLILVWLAPASLGPAIYAAAQAAGFGLAFLITAIFALQALEATLDFRTIGLIGLANVAMAAMLWPLRGLFDARVELVLLVSLGAAIYLSLILIGDIGACRSLLLDRWRPGKDDKKGGR